MPSQAYNPLFIYGPPGLGKTHLLHSVGNYVNAFGGGLDRPLRHRRGVHERVPRRAARAQPRRVQGALPRRRRAADRRRPVPRAQGAQRGGALSHVQRALRRRQPARDHLRPPARATSATSRTACASASPPASSPTSSGRTSPRGWRSCANAHATTASTLAADAAELLAARVTTNVRALEGALIRLVALRAR